MTSISLYDVIGQIYSGIHVPFAQMKVITKQLSDFIRLLRIFFEDSITCMSRREELSL